MTTVPGLRPINFANVGKEQPHHLIDSGSGVRVHVQNPNRNPSISHVLENGFLVQKTDPGPVPQPGDTLYGMDYVKQVLELGLYRGKTPHHNLPVMHEGNMEFPVVVVTPGNAYQTTMNSSNEQKRAVLLTAEVGSNFFNPPLAATKTAGVAVGGAVLAHGGRGFLDDVAERLAKLPFVRNLVDDANVPASAMYKTWTELQSAGRAFKAELYNSVNQAKKVIDDLDLKDVNYSNLTQDHHISKAIYGDLNKTAAALEKHNSKLADGAEADVAVAMWEIDFALRRKLRQDGNFSAIPDTEGMSRWYFERGLTRDNFAARANEVRLTKEALERKVKHLKFEAFELGRARDAMTITRAIDLRNAIGARLVEAEITFRVIQSDSRGGPSEALAKKIAELSTQLKRFDEVVIPEAAKVNQAYVDAMNTLDKFDEKLRAVSHLEAQLSSYKNYF